MKLSEAGRKSLLEPSEGLRLEAYQDSVGVWTIGYGHTEGVQAGMTITPEQADMLLAVDVEHVENVLNKLIPADCTQNQFDALVDFGFNLGVGALKTMMAHGWQQIPTQMRFWVHAGGKVLDGLVIRREKEIALFNLVQ